MTRLNITEHEGKKYIREIQSCLSGGKSTMVDIYEVLTAFGVTCQRTGHAIKKLLCAGQRGKGDRVADLRGAIAAINRAIDEEVREGAPDFEVVSKPLQTTEVDESFSVLRSEASVEQRKKIDRDYPIKPIPQDPKEPKNTVSSRVVYSINALLNYQIGDDGQQALWCLKHEILPFVQRCDQSRPFTRAFADVDPHPARWVVIPVTDNDQGMPGKPVTIGYRVGWSFKNEAGETLLVRHYLTDGNEGSPSLGWCKNAAESDAERMNQQGKLPFEFHAGRLSDFPVSVSTSPEPGSPGYRYVITDLSTSQPGSLFLLRFKGNMPRLHEVLQTEEGALEIISISNDDNSCQAVPQRGVKV